MKRMIVIALCATLLFSLAACAGNGTPSDTSYVQQNTSGNTPADSPPANSPQTASPANTPNASPSDTATAAQSTSPDPEPSHEPVDVIIFAAASMTETINKIIVLYKSVAPYVTIIPTFDSSGTLKTQIEEGALCDIFISAAPKQMNQLDVTANEEVNPGKLDFVMQGTRLNLLENKVALVYCSI